VKLKKLHKMGDVANTILKHFEKEKMIIDQKKIHIFAFSSQIFNLFRLEITKPKLSKNQKSKIT